MSAASKYVFRCGNCGADSEIAGVGVKTVICGFCNWSSLRSESGAEAMGEVSQVTPLASNLQIGTTGSYAGRQFEVRGQIQLDHGAGLWNEWAVQDGGGLWFWIAEAQGEILVFEEEEAPDGLRPKDLQLMDPVSLGPKGKFIVTELGKGTVVTARGELPVAIEAGEITDYADLQRGADEFATLDWTRGDIEVFVGRRVPLSSLGLDPASQPEHQPHRIEARRLDCANCGADLTVRDPERALRLGCESCGSLLDVDGHETRVLIKDEQSKAKLALPLGSTAEIEGLSLTILGAMERGVKYEGRWYPWREYLCRTPEGAYRWVVENNGHWMLSSPSAVSAFQRSGGRLRMDGKTYKHFSGGKAVVRWVVGEFYWRVKVGDEAETDDYVAGSRMLSTERSSGEAAASIGMHVERGDIGKAFGVASLPRAKGVGPIQPNRMGARETWGLFAVAAIALLAMLVMRGVSADSSLVHDSGHGPIPSPAGTELVAFTDPFELTGDQANVEVQLSAPGIDQGWVGLSGALVEMDSGEVTTFATEAQRYSGVSGGESWSEGNRKGSTILGSIPAGQYRMRLAFTGFDKGCGSSVEVQVKRDVPRPSYALFAFLALLIPAIFVQVLSIKMEAARWADSDHPWGES